MPVITCSSGNLVDYLPSGLIYIDISSLRGVKDFSRRYVQAKIRTKYILNTYKTPSIKLVLERDTASVVDLHVFGPIATDVDSSCSVGDTLVLSDFEVDICPRNSRDGCSYHIILDDQKATQTTIWVLKAPQSVNARNSSTPSRGPPASTSASQSKSPQKVLKASQSVNASNSSTSVRVTTSSSSASQSKSRKKSPSKNTSYNYTLLKDVVNHATMHIYGVVSHILQPFRTTGSDYYMMISVVDPSLPNTDEALACSLFHKEREKLPTQAAVGNIIRIHRLKIQTFQGKIQGRNGPGCHWVLFQGSYENRISSSDNYTIQNGEEDKFRELLDWWEDISLISQESDVLDLAGLTPMVAVPRVFKTLKEVCVGATVNIYAVVIYCRVAAQTGRTDYHLMMNITDPSLENKDMKLTCNLFDADRNKLPSHASRGDVIRFRNLNIREFKKTKQGTKGNNFEWVLFKGSFANRSASSPDFVVEEDERIKVESMLDWWPQSTSFNQVLCKKYFNIVCQVILNISVDDLGYRLLKVWDGTKFEGPILTINEVGADKDETLAQVAGELNLIHDVFLFDNHIWSARDIQPRDYIKLTNLHAALVKDQVEMTLHGGNSYDRGVKRLKHDDREVIKLKSVLDPLISNFTGGARKEDDGSSGASTSGDPSHGASTSGHPSSGASTSHTASSGASTSGHPSHGASTSGHPSSGASTSHAASSGASTSHAASSGASTFGHLSHGSSTSDHGSLTQSSKQGGDNSRTDISPRKNECKGKSSRKRLCDEPHDDESQSKKYCSLRRSSVCDAGSNVTASSLVQDNNNVNRESDTTKATRKSDNTATESSELLDSNNSCVSEEFDRLTLLSSISSPPASLELTERDKYYTEAILIRDKKRAERDAAHNTTSNESEAILSKETNSEELDILSGISMVSSEDIQLSMDGSSSTDHSRLSAGVQPSSLCANHMTDGKSPSTQGRVFESNSNEIASSQESFQTAFDPSSPMQKVISDQTAQSPLSSGLSHNALIESSTALDKRRAESRREGTEIKQGKRRKWDVKSQKAVKLKSNFDFTSGSDDEVNIDPREEEKIKGQNLEDEMPSSQDSYHTAKHLPSPMISKIPCFNKSFISQPLSSTLEVLQPSPIVSQRTHLSLRSQNETNPSNASMKERASSSLSKESGDNTVSSSTDSCYSVPNDRQPIEFDEEEITSSMDPEDSTKTYETGKGTLSYGRKDATVTASKSNQARKYLKLHTFVKCRRPTKLKTLVRLSQYLPCNGNQSSFVHMCCFECKYMVSSLDIRSKRVAKCPNGCGELHANIVINMWLSDGEYEINAVLWGQNAIEFFQGVTPQDLLHKTSAKEKVQKCLDILCPPDTELEHKPLMECCVFSYIIRNKIHFQIFDTVVVV